MFQACEVKIAKIAAHSTPRSRPGNSAMNPVTVIERNPRIGTDWRMSSTGIRIFSAWRFLAATARVDEAEDQGATSAAAIRKTVRSAYSGEPPGSSEIGSASAV